MSSFMIDTSKNNFLKKWKKNQTTFQVLNEWSFLLKTIELLIWFPFLINKHEGEDSIIRYPLSKENNSKVQKSFMLGLSNNGFNFIVDKSRKSTFYFLWKPIYKYVICKEVKEEEKKNKAILTTQGFISRKAEKYILWWFSSF